MNTFPRVTDQILTFPETSAQLRKFKLSQETKIIFLKAVRQHDAHLAAHRKEDRKFEKVRAEFLKHLLVVTQLH